MAERINCFRDLRVYQMAIDAAMEIFEVTNTYPATERYSLVNQSRRASRSVCANLAEAWRRRRYRAAFIAKLNECEGEGSEMQVWVEIAFRCGYITNETFVRLDNQYERINRQLARMINQADKWIIKF